MKKIYKFYISSVHCPDAEYLSPGEGAHGLQSRYLFTCPDFIHKIIDNLGRDAQIYIKTFGFADDAIEDGIASAMKNHSDLRIYIDGADREHLLAKLTLRDHCHEFPSKCGGQTSKIIAYEATIAHETQGACAINCDVVRCEYYLRFVYEDGSHPVFKKNKRAWYLELWFVDN